MDHQTQSTNLKEQIRDLKHNIHMVDRLMHANPDVDHTHNKESVRIWNTALVQVEGDLAKLQKKAKPSK